ncbi:MAG: radical SAM protein [Alphaproteobacteria bacterium]|nr:radical SAM protein [Alphaproteobacteria bacterium]
MLDLNEKVTVFIVTVGGLDYAPCRAALRAQDSQFNLEIIRNIAPMNAAFQQMAERCKTPFFVQVDEDMILEPHAVRQLYEEMQEQAPNVAFHCLSLWDTDLGYPIDGCKIYRHAIMAQVPWRDSYSCEVDQFERLWESGFQFSRRWRPYRGDHVIGEHGRFWTPKTLFQRYRRIAIKSRINPKMFAWWDQWGSNLLQRFAFTGTQRALFAMLGWIDGKRTELSAPVTEANFRQSRHDPDFSAFRDFRLKDSAIVPVEIATRAKARKLPGPRELNVYQTSRCNFTCTWCRRQHQDLPSARDVEPELLKRALELYPSITSVCFAGFGEPLLSEHLADCVAVAKSLKKQTLLITNGSLLESTSFDLLCQFDQVSVSLNAESAEAHSLTTGSKDFHEILDTIRVMKETGIDCMLSFVVTRENWARVGLYLDLAQDLDCGVDLLSVLPHYSASRDDRAFWHAALLRDNIESQMWIDKLRKHAWAAHVRTWPTLIGRDRDACPRTCDSMSVSMGINGDGNITACRRVMPPAPETGHLEDRDPWNGAGCSSARLAFKADGIDVCSMCFGNWKTAQ